MAAEIRLQQVDVDYGSQPILRGLCLHVAPGQFVSLVGPSGCGKTTVLRLVAGLVPPTSGSVVVRCNPSEDNGRVSPRLAFVFQDPTLLPWRNVVENVALPLELSGRPRAAVRQAAYAAVARVGLTPDDVRKYPHMLSGGMRMRVSLARSLVTQPDVLLLDEPFAALDDLLRQRMNEDLLAIWQQEQWTALFVTHHVAEAVFLSQRVVVLGGKPCRVRSSFTVPFPYPRHWSLRGTAEFAACCQEVSRCLREER